MTITELLECATTSGNFAVAPSKQIKPSRRKKPKYGQWVEFSDKDIQKDK